jgi:hydrogenase maturation factor
MCLTIPKKVLSEKKDGRYIVEKNNGEKQEVKTIIKVKVGDFVITQSNIIIQKLSKKQAQEINELLN